MEQGSDSETTKQHTKGTHSLGFNLQQPFSYDFRLHSLKHSDWKTSKNFHQIMCKRKNWKRKKRKHEIVAFNCSGWASQRENYECWPRTHTLKHSHTSWDKTQKTVDSLNFCFLVCLLVLRLFSFYHTTRETKSWSKWYGVSFLPFFIFVSNEKFVELLTLEFHFVFVILLNGIRIGNGIVLCGQKLLERQHGRLRLHVWIW